jgi:tetratricopeptide (TPR) repeat protein
MRAMSDLPAASPALRSRRRIVLIALAILVAAIVLAVGGGFLAGSTARARQARATVEAQAREQFDLAIEDMRAGRYSFARQRLEYVLSLDPNYPAASDLLQEALRGLNSTPTPTGTPTAPPTATLDLPRAQQLFAQAEQQFVDKNWAAMIQTLLTLRVEVPAFQPLRVDGLLYTALRNLGVELIDQGKLEEGLYYLDLAKNYSPLDNHASQRAAWAQLLLNLYQAANVFFETDWEKAVETFGQVYAMAPFFRDTPVKYPAALFGYGDQLMQEGKPCDAVPQFQAAANLQPSNADYSDGLARANRDCAASRPTAVPSPTPGGETPTPSPTP